MGKGEGGRVPPAAYGFHGIGVTRAGFPSSFGGPVVGVEQSDLMGTISVRAEEVISDEVGEPVEYPKVWTGLVAVESFRHLQCESYGACLRKAAAKGWRAWGCAECEGAPEGLTPPPPKPWLRMDPPPKRSQPSRHKVCECGQKMRRKASRCLDCLRAEEEAAQMPDALAAWRLRRQGRGTEWTDAKFGWYRGRARRLLGYAGSGSPQWAHRLRAKMEAEDGE